MESVDHGEQQRQQSNTTNQILFRIDDKKYELTKILGRGSFGYVYLCRKQDNNICQYVALKMININSFFDYNNEIDLAINEIRILSILKHENIIKYMGSFLWHDKFYIEMEYADAGTLKSFLSQLNCSLCEYEILALFLQLSNAVNYLHFNNVIHRDIKTKNIFLNKQGFLKLGDFGISKILIPNSDARSFVGTPVYICPEIYAGKAYNKPVDIWSMGCVLYEMSQAVNQLDNVGIIARMIPKIIRGHKNAISFNGKYSKSFEKLLNSLLQHNPNKRPTAQQIVKQIKVMMNNLSIENLKGYNNLNNQNSIQNLLIIDQLSSPRPNFTSYHSYIFQLNLSKQDLGVKLIKMTCSPTFSIKQIAISDRHLIAISNSNHCYSWGYGPNGELGHGHSIHSLSEARLIKCLNNSIIKIACGNGFSVFVDRNGLVYSCGDYKSHCLGSDEQHNIYRPTIVNKLLDINVVDISCSNDHIVVVSSNGDCYGWGSNEFYKLGIPNIDDKRPILFPAHIQLECRVKSVCCGPNSTAFIDDCGSIWLCGDNCFNQLALNHYPYYDYINCCKSNQQIYEVVQKPMKCYSITKRVKSVCLGERHSFFVLEDSTIIGAGDNTYGQLGAGHWDQVRHPIRVSPLKPKQRVKKIKVGSNYTVMLTKDSVYFIGSRTTKDNYEPCDLTTRPATMTDDALNGNDFIIANHNESVMDIIKNYGPDYSIIKISKPKIIIRRINDLERIDCRQQIILFAQSILNVYLTKTSPENSLIINDIYCHHDMIYVLVDSTKKQHKPPPPPPPSTSSSSESLSLSSQLIDSTKHSTNIVKQLQRDMLLLMDQSSETQSQFSYSWINEI